MISRRTALLMIAAAGVVLSGSHAALAAQPVVEVLAMAHWPVQRALKPVRDFLAKYRRARPRQSISISKAPTG